MAAVIPKLDETLGAAFLGTIASASLYGITFVQTYIYYRRSARDPVYLKFIVGFLWTLDNLHLALITHAVYYYAVTNFANPMKLASPTWSILVHIVVTGVSDLIVRSVFCVRVWNLSNRNRPLAVLIMLASLVVFCGSISFSAKSFKVHTFAAFAEISNILYMSFGAGVVADLLIAGSLCLFLAKRKTGFAKTDSIVHSLIVYSINTGALTSLCALMCLITYATMPTNFVFIAFYFVLPKLFLNSLLATLNARQALRKNNSGGMLSIPLSATSSSPRSSVRPQGAREDEVNLHIQIQTTTDMKTDSVPHGLENGEETKWRAEYTGTIV